MLLVIAAVLVIAGIGYLIGSRPGQETGAPKGAGTEQPDAALELRPAESNGEQNSSVKTPNQKPALLPRGSRTAAVSPESGSPPPRPDAHDGLTFEEAMKLFGLFGYRYQFVECHGMPGNFVMKQNTRFMLDNRDPVAHNFVVATQSFLIPGYDFAIALARDLGKYMITCDGGGAAGMEVVP